MCFLEGKLFGFRGKLSGVEADYALGLSSVGPFFLFF